MSDIDMRRYEGKNIDGPIWSYDHDLDHDEDAAYRQSIEMALMENRPLDAYEQRWLMIQAGFDFEQIDAWQRGHGGASTLRP